MSWWRRKPKRVRLHLAGAAPSLSGILVGCVGGHYVLRTPSVLESEDQTVRLEGHLEVPREQVWFVQVMGS